MSKIQSGKIPVMERTLVKKSEAEWNTYRTRFLVRARRLSRPMAFVDALGREHRGRRGDYLMESSEGLLRIAPRKFFEHAYVPIETLRLDIGMLAAARGEKNRGTTRGPFLG
ncbi:MAG TPA: hypothetical protein VGF06_03895 [Terriglobales bacterium]